LISVHHPSAASALGDLSRFRTAFYHCLTTRADALFELTDALLCAQGPITSLVELSLATEHRRGHGSLYAGLNAGRIDINRLRTTLAGQPIPRDTDGRIVLSIDVSNWLRPAANTSPERLFCHTQTHGGGQAQIVPGWPYSFIAALEPGRSSWTALLDVARMRPSDDPTDTAATQLRDLVHRLITAGHWQPGDPQIWIVGDSGYDGSRLAFLLADLPVRILVRLRRDRVLRFAPPPRPAGSRGRSIRHGARFSFIDPPSWPAPAQTSTTHTTRYGLAHAQSWDRLHTKLRRAGAWTGHEGLPPIVEGTVIRLQVARLPGTATPKPLWLWYSAPQDRAHPDSNPPNNPDSNPDSNPDFDVDPDAVVTAGLMDRLWQMFLRRFDLEHTFRFLKQTLGWTRPALRDPAAADRWTWLLIAVYTQLRAARYLVEDLRRPWERAPATPARLSPARVRRGFRAVRAVSVLPARAPKLCRPGPGRPVGSRNARPARRYDPGKIKKTDTTR
jgi:hypothetical protein